MNKIPIEVYINNILPFTYNIQPKDLLDDIKNYYNIKSILNNNIFDMDLIKHELLALLYIDHAFNPNLIMNILNRYYNNLLLKKMTILDFIFLGIHTKFYIIFGLLTVNERNQFLEHILQDNGIWFKRY